METDVLVTGVWWSWENPTLSPFEDTFHILPLCESQLIIPAVIKKKKKRKAKWTSETPSVASNGCQVNYLLQCIICSLILHYVSGLIRLYKSHRVFRVDVDKVFPKCHQLADMESEMKHSSEIMSSENVPKITTANFRHVVCSERR